MNGVSLWSGSVLDEMTWKRQLEIVRVGRLSVCYSPSCQNGSCFVAGSQQIVEFVVLGARYPHIQSRDAAFWEVSVSSAKTAITRQSPNQPVFLCLASLGLCFDVMLGVARKLSCRGTYMVQVSRDILIVTSPRNSFQDYGLQPRLFLDWNLLLAISAHLHATWSIQAAFF